MFPLALTATATDRVRQDIIQQLLWRNPHPHCQLQPPQSLLRSPAQAEAELFPTAATNLEQKVQGLSIALVAAE